MTPTSFIVSWNAETIGTPPFDYITEYRVSGTTQWINNPLGRIRALTQTVSGLTPDTLYEVRVQVYNEAGTNFSGVATARTLVAVVPPTESVQGTTLTSASGQIVDANLAIWTLRTSVSSGLQVLRDGVDMGTVNTLILLYWNHLVYREAGPVGSEVWYLWNGSSWVVQSTGDPRNPVVPPTESVQGTSLTTTTGSIIDASLVAWTLRTSASSGLQVYRAGVLTTSSNVILLLYWNHIVYQQNNAGVWRFWDGAAWVATGDPRTNESANDTVITSTAGSIIDATAAVWTLAPQAVVAGRNPFLQPYASNDFWNIGIGSAATWTTAGDPATVKLNSLFGAFNTNGNYNQPFFLGHASDPLITLHITDTDTYPMADVQIRIPVGSAPAIGVDKHMNFMDATQPTKLFSAYNCTVNNADGNGAVTVSTTQITAVFGSVYDVRASGVYPFGRTSFPPLGPSTSTVGQYNFIAGTIRDWEILAGSIKHALRYVISADATAPVGNYFDQNVPWPEPTTDYCGVNVLLPGCPSMEYTGTIPYGRTIGIPKTVSLSSLGLSAGGLVLGRALQDYGAVIRDTGGTNQLTLYTENISAAALNIVNTQMQPDWNNILKGQLRIMTNQSTNGLSNVNGGGTYPTPLPSVDTALVT